MATRTAQILRTKLNSWPGALAAYSLACLLVPLPALRAMAAASPGYAYGEYLVRADAVPEDSPPLNAPPPQTTDSERPERYTQRLQALEAAQGPYGPALSEALEDMARYHESRGDTDQALRLYRRALHLVRVNEGLYSVSQAPLVRAELGLYHQLGDFASLDDRYDYYFRLFGGGRPPFTELRVRAALGYLSWQREALRRGLQGRAQRRLLDALALNDQMLDAVRIDDAAEAAWLVDLTLSQISNLYLAQALFPQEEQEAWSVGGLVGSSVLDDPTPQDFDASRLQRIRRSALGRGAELMESALLALGEDSAASDRARLRVALGDWFQWHDRSREAAEHYARAHALLAASEDTAALQAAFGNPVELPDNGVFHRLRDVNRAPGAEVQVRMNVSALGYSSDVQVVQAPEGEERSAQRIVRALGSVRFRPRWLHGHAEAVTGLQRGYRSLR